MSETKQWQVRFTLPDDLRWQLRELANRCRITTQEALVEAVAGWVDQVDPSEQAIAISVPDYYWTGIRIAQRQGGAPQVDKYLVRVLNWFQAEPRETDPVAEPRTTKTLRVSEEVMAHLAPVPQEQRSELLASAIIAYEMWCEMAADPDAPVEEWDGEEGEELL
jgi:predicted transcriptional regulator